jgi:hypothetical protein
MIIYSVDQVVKELEAFIWTRSLIGLNVTSI